MQELLQEVLDYEKHSYMPHNGTIERLEKVLQVLGKEGKMLNVNIVCEHEKYMPTYANDTDACMDLKVKVAEEVETKEGEKTVINTKFIKPNETVILGSGIKVSVPVGCVMLMYPRSSTGIKLHCMLSNTTGVIDSGYRDEVKIAITNFGSETVCLQDGQRVAQFMIIKRPKLALHCVEDNEDFREGDRQGGIGSTGV